MYSLSLGKSHHKILKLNYLIKCSLNHDKVHYFYHAANLNNMKNDLRFVDWPEILDSCDTIWCWERFLNTIKSKNILKSKILKSKNRSYHCYVRTNNQQDHKTYAKYRNQSKHKENPKLSMKSLSLES